MKAKLKEYSYDEIHSKIETLTTEPSKKDNFDLVNGIKELVPEYKSQNSVYSKLDRA